jgi:hypothetical protein
MKLDNQRKAKENKIKNSTEKCGLSKLINYKDIHMRSSRSYRA